MLLKLLRLHSIPINDSGFINTMQGEEAGERRDLSNLVSTTRAVLLI